MAKLFFSKRLFVCPGSVTLDTVWVDNYVRVLEPSYFFFLPASTENDWLEEGREDAGLGLTIGEKGVGFVQHILIFYVWRKKN